MLFREDRCISFLIIHSIRQNGENYDKSRYREQESHDEKRPKAVAFLSRVMGSKVCESQFRQNADDKPDEKLLQLETITAPFS